MTNPVAVGLQIEGVLILVVDLISYLSRNELIPRDVSLPLAIIGLMIIFLGTAAEPVFMRSYSRSSNAQPID